MTREVQSTLRAYQSRLATAISSIETQSVERLVGRLLECREVESRVFLAGNGGSASTASHFAIDWMLGSGLVNPALQVISLSDSPPSLTATGNDMSFDQVFSRQVRALGRPGDLLVLVTASGNSKNLIEAAIASRESGLTSLSITAFDGGLLKQMTDDNIHVQTEIGDYGVAEDCHLALGHMVKQVLASLDDTSRE
jgi:Phosphoheptose isomerase